jgi:hypothetical protein
MDIIVSPAERANEWKLTDLLGRSLGVIQQTSLGRLTVQPEGGAVETMSGISHGVFASLDAALADIEKRRGWSLRRTSADQDIKERSICQCRAIISIGR